MLRSKKTIHSGLKLTVLALFCCFFTLPAYAMQPVPRVAKDTTPPSGSISIPGSFQSQKLELRLSAQDNTGGTGLSKMQFSNNGTLWSSPEAYKRDKTWTAAKDFGFTTIYARFSDQAGNWSKAYSTTTFISNPDKVKGITNYDPDINDDNRVDAMDVQLTVNAVLGHNIGSLNADVNQDGGINAMDVQLVINAVLGIDINQPPKINLIIPADGSEFIANAKIDIQITAAGSHMPLQYRFLIGGSLARDWSASNTFAWQTSDADTGAVNITCEVKDSKDQITSRTISYRINNPTVQEILQKVVDNYARIYDFKADMVLSSTFNGQPFGTTEYCRYYFKAPNKEKTETYSESSRTTKTDIIIINGSNMHLIDPVKNIKQQVDLLTDAGIDATQFNQTNIYYNPTLFINQHTITKDNLNPDSNNMIITLDALPKTQNNMYDKLNIAIDYSKGIVTRYSIYRKNTLGQLELVQETKAVESQMISNAAWLPIKMTKTPNSTSGNLISTLTYSNLQINTGLRDSDFDPDKQ